VSGAAGRNMHGVSWSRGASAVAHFGVEGLLLAYQLPNRSTVPTEAASSISQELTAASERNGEHPLTAANLDHFKALRAMAAVDRRFPIGSTKIGDH
jgi:hypothetical protein